MDYPKIIVSNQKEESISIQRVNNECDFAINNENSPLLTVLIFRPAYETLLVHILLLAHVELVLHCVCYINISFAASPFPVSIMTMGHYRTASETAGGPIVARYCMMTGLMQFHY